MPTAVYASLFIAYLYFQCNVNEKMPLATYSLCIYCCHQNKKKEGERKRAHYGNKRDLKFVIRSILMYFIVWLGCASNYISFKYSEIVNTNCKLSNLVRPNEWDGFCIQLRIKLKNLFELLFTVHAFYSKSSAVMLMKIFYYFRFDRNEPCYWYWRIK